MTWRTVNILSCDPSTPKAVQSSRATLEKRAHELAKEREGIDGRLAQVNDAELSPKTLKSMDEVRVSKILAWQTEATLRDDCAAWLTDYEAALRELVDGAIDARQQAEVELRQKLVGIGYLDGPEAEQHPARIQPGMIFGHPSIRAADERRRELDGAGEQVRTAARSNREAHEATAAEMVAYRTRLMSVV